MHRTAVAPFFNRFPHGAAHAWLARRWYYTPKSHRAYSVREISPGDRRLLAEFALALMRAAPARDREAHQRFAQMLFDRVLPSAHRALGLLALENTSTGDRIIGAAAYAGADRCDAGEEFHIAVADDYRDEQVGRTLIATLLRHARRAGVTRLSGEMHWANRPMHALAESMGFVIEPLARDRNLRRLVLSLR